MTLSLLDVSNLLSLIKLYQKESISSKKYVQNSYINQPVKNIKLPNYEEIENFCKQLGLIKANSNEIMLTSQGKSCLLLHESNENKKFNKFILECCFESATIGKDIQNVLSEFHLGQNNTQWIPKWELYDLFDNPSILPILYEAQFLRKTQLTVEVNDNLSKTLQQNTKRKLSLKQLETKLETQKIIGQIAEEIALQYEKSLLSSNGLIEESKNVRQISGDYSNAGYDIESFSTKTLGNFPDKFIEVKGSTGKNLDFHWSINEIDTAEKHRENYWIYFVSQIDVPSRSSPNEPIKIPDPFKNIFSNPSYQKDIEGYHVMEKPSPDESGDNHNF